MQDLRICMVTSCFPPSVGGIERCVFELSKRMKKMGHQVTVVTSSRGLAPRSYNTWSEEVGHVIRYPERFTLVEVPFVPQIPLRLLGGDYDAVHLHGMTPSQTDLALLVSKTLKAKIIYTHHFDPQTKGGRLTSMYSILGRTVVGLADEITASTASYAQSSPILAPLINNVRIIPMGVDPDNFEKRHHSLASDERRRYEAFDFRVLYVGKLIYYKGLDHLLQAFSLVQHPSSCLMIVGEGREKSNLMSLAYRLGIASRVLFLGRQPDTKLPSLYAIANVVALPSVTRREAFGIVLLEAMASGKPVVASAIPGVSELVEDGKTGFLVPPSNPPALAHALRSLLRDKRSAKTMGDNGRVLVKNKYNWDRITQEFLELYSEKSPKQRNH